MAGMGVNGFGWIAGAGGANGGVGANVTVNGNWNITTLGASAYGIWAQSVGGNAGTGGCGGWLWARAVAAAGPRMAARSRSPAVE